MKHHVTKNTREKRENHVHGIEPRTSRENVTYTITRKVGNNQEKIRKKSGKNRENQAARRDHL